MLEALFALIVLGLDVWAIINVVGSSVSTAAKAAWVVAIILLPLLGFIAWLVFGPRSSRSARV